MSNPPTPAEGLSAAEAARRLAEHGLNELAAAPRSSKLRLLLRQFTSPLIALLAVAGGVAGALGEVVDAVAIATIVVLNGLVGFFQEARAEEAVLALRSMTAPRARVLRNGVAQVVAAREVVPGDLLLLEAGDRVAADAILLEAAALTTNEAPLTGESAPVAKGADPVAADAPLAERSDRVWAGTEVAAGAGRALVEATGTHTELGRIAHLLTTTEEGPTPLQQQLAGVGRSLLWISLGIVGVVAALGLARGEPALAVLLGAVSLAVAAVPEGLPAVVTLALASGVQRMAGRQVLVRRLPAVETLGATTVICTDKTGTLTTGQMAVREVWGGDHHAVVYTATACCDADPPVGDPTEVAIVLAGRERGIARQAIEAELPRVRVNPFDATRKRMSILRADGVLYVKGAVDLLLPLCPSADPTAVGAANTEMAERGMRVLAVARGRGPDEHDLELLGLLGIADPPRTEATAAVEEARAAGIRTVMITGDHPVTARAIAREMGILAIGDDPAGRVHARATPEDKLDIVRALRREGAVVAMTGDGVNDAPALREADVGIAMGRAGTEVTREAADVVLADDNFASIVAGIREGRAIFDNIRKTLVYLLTGNVAELTVMLGAAVLGLPAPLSPLQLLWVNLVTDGLPALALGMEPAEADVLRRPPRSPRAAMLGRPQWIRILLLGAVEAGVVLGAWAWVLPADGAVAAQHMAFSTLVFCELFRSFSARSTRRLFWEVGAFTNLRLLGVVVLSALAQFALTELPFAREVFGLGRPDPLHLGIAAALGLVPVTVAELAKLALRGKLSRLVFGRGVDPVR